MPLDQAPPRSNRFGSPLVLSRVYWVRHELVVEVKYLTRTDGNLFRQVVYQGLREDKEPSECSVECRIEEGVHLDPAGLPKEGRGCFPRSSPLRPGSINGMVFG
jgi:hypothetical protein